jgi:hypothetical protein
MCMRAATTVRKIHNPALITTLPESASLDRQQPDLWFAAAAEPARDVFDQRRIDVLLSGRRWDEFARELLPLESGR